MPNLRTLPTNPLQDAESAAQAQEPMQLSSESFVAFLHSVDAAPKKNKALIRAFKRHSQSVVVSDPESA